MRRLRSAFQAATGRPRWNTAPASEAAARAAAAARIPAGGGQQAPAGGDRRRQRAEAQRGLDTSVSHSSGQWASSGRRSQSPAAIVSGGTPGGSVMRVVDSVSDAAGRWGASPARWSARQASTSTFSTVMASVGQAATHAGANPSSSRGWHMSHLVAIRRSGWKAGTEYGQVQVQ